MPDVIGPLTYTPSIGRWGKGHVEGLPITADISYLYGPREPLHFDPDEDTAAGSTGSFHHGWDLARPAGMDWGDFFGSPIRAPINATVDGIKFNPRGGGHELVLSHPDAGPLAIKSRYLHMDRPPNDGHRDLTVGQQVYRGQVIGQIGSSGLSNGPHLHWQFQHAAGSATDPLQLIEQGVIVATLPAPDGPIIPTFPDGELVVTAEEASAWAFYALPPGGPPLFGHEADARREDEVDYLILTRPSDKGGVEY